MPIFNFKVEVVTDGIVSIEAETLADAVASVNVLQKYDREAVNVEMGSGETRYSEEGFEDKSPDDGTHYFMTPRSNAKANAEILKEIMDEEADDQEQEEWNETYPGRTPNQCVLEHDHHKGRCKFND